MNAKEIRNSFLKFFEEKNHRIVSSAPVVPHGDPTLLFTNAGMNQFKDVFLGTGSREYSRAVDTQKCIRVSGKHNDLEEVGVDTYHHTLFEMLGNWSFGDYYKEEAIEWAWELLTEVWKLDKERLYATVYRTDDEAYDIWKKFLPESRIQRFDEKDNFWEMGETGPCGPCSEIHYDKTPGMTGGSLVNAGSPDVIEIWNLVFIQYNRNSSGVLEPLKYKHVDTGMGFERIVSVIQGKPSNYDTDVFMPIISEISKMCGIAYPEDIKDKNGIAMRVIADHLRTLSFAIADGALPGNDGRGYVLRRILRRASRYARNLGFKEPIVYKLVDILIETLGDVFPEIVSERKTIERVIRGEEESFLATLERGLAIFEEIASKPESLKNNCISGLDAFLLYDTFGFPLDLTQLIARERGMSVDVEDFERNMELQKERSRAARKSHAAEVSSITGDYVTEFTGYNEFESKGKILFVEDDKVVLDKTPFYAESGGQISDTGTLLIGGDSYKVKDVQKIGNFRVHICDRNVEPLIGQDAVAKIDIDRRKKIMRNHSATHLLHEALRQILGNHIKQAGSLVHPDYLRFDFNHFEKVSPENIRKIEKIVNRKIFEEIAVDIQEHTIEEAKKNSKVKMFFGDKYGDVVRVLTMDPNFSIELCGGTHVKNTADIGFFKITTETAISAGVRRIEAITGPGIEDYIDNLLSIISDKNHEKAELLDKIKQLEKEVSSFKLEQMTSGVDEILANAKNFENIKVATAEIPDTDMDSLRNLGDELRNKLGKTGIGLLATISGDKVQLCCVVTDDLKNKFPAGKLIGSAAKFLGGGGGGKPHMATAGGKDVAKLPELLERFIEIAIL
ncbi:MAG: alanine--tRNA ligase [Ignavibacteria bacterium GWF2_33_9]|nr:MAG: alanine--tRNA ligase [Ignavibacteria bacterium GWF2_33_9]